MLLSDCASFKNTHKTQHNFWPKTNKGQRINAYTFPFNLFLKRKMRAFRGCSICGMDYYICGGMIGISNVQ